MSGETFAFFVKLALISAFLRESVFVFILLNVLSIHHN